MSTLMMSPQAVKRQQELAGDVAVLERYLEVCTSKKTYNAIEKLIHLLTINMNRLEQE